MQLRVRGEGRFTSKGSEIRKASDFSTAILELLNYWSNAFKIQRQHGVQPRIAYPTKLPIKRMGKIKTFSDEHSFEIFTSSGSSLRELLGICSTKIKGYIKKEEDSGIPKVGNPTQKRHKRSPRGGRCTVHSILIGSCGKL